MNGETERQKRILQVRPKANGVEWRGQKWSCSDDRTTILGR